VGINELSSIFSYAWLWKQAAASISSRQKKRKKGKSRFLLKPAGNRDSSRPGSREIEGMMIAGETTSTIFACDVVRRQDSKVKIAPPFLGSPGWLPSRSRARPLQQQAVKLITTPRAANLGSQLHRDGILASLHMMGSEVVDIVESDRRASAGHQTRNFDINATASLEDERRPIT